MPNSPTPAEPPRAYAVLIPALVDHPGNVAWQRAYELAAATEATLHVVLPLEGDLEDPRARERALVAAERGLQQWVRGRTMGASLAQRTTLHVTWQSDTLPVLAWLAAEHGVETVVLGATEGTGAVIDALLADPPCSLLLATERATERDEAPRRPDRDRADPPADLTLRSRDLATPGPLPEPDVVTDAVG